MNMTENIFKRKAFDFQKLIAYGFRRTDKGFEWFSSLMDGQFMLVVIVSDSGKIEAKVLETETEEEYALFRVAEANGAFVGQLRAEAENILSDIAQNCCYMQIFKSAQAQMVIDYAQKQYATVPEYLWPKFPDNAVLRRADDKKWYAVILTVERRKLGLEGDENVEILDLRVRPDELETFIDKKRYFSGYHMNKRHWYTILLDGSLPDEEIRQRIDASFYLHKK